MRLPSPAEEVIVERIKTAPRAGRSRPLDLSPLLCLVPTAALVAWYLFVRDFSGLFGQDPYAYFDYAVGPMRAALQGLQPLHSFYWPLGYPALVAIVSLAAGGTHIAAQAVNVVAGLLSVLLTYAVGQEALRRTGIEAHVARRACMVGAVAFGTGGYLVESGVVAMADAVALCAALLSAWALFRALRSGGKAESMWIALSGVALGYSVITRWGQAWLLPVWLLAAIPTSREVGQRIRLVTTLLLACALAVVPQLALAALVPRGSVRPHAFMGDFGGAGAAWQPVHLLQRAFVNTDGSFHYALPNLVYYLTGPFRTMYLTPLLAPPIIFALMQMGRRRQWALTFLLVWPALLLVADAGLPWQDPRFILMAIPPLAILAGLGMAEAWEQWPAWHTVLGGVAILSLLAVLAGGVRGADTMIAAHASDERAAAWAAAELPPHAHLLSFGLTATLIHSGIPAEELADLGPARLHALETAYPRLYLLVSVPVIQGQAARLPAGEDFAALSHAPGLSRIGARDGYTLFRVERS